MHGQYLGKLAALVLILGMLHLNDSFAASESLQTCERAFTEIQSSTANVGEQIEKFRTLEKECQGTGLFEVRVSELYIADRDYSRALQAVERGLTYDTSFNKELLLAKGNIALHQKDYATAESAYRVVTEKYANWNVGFDYLGFSIFAQGRNEQAIEFLDKANVLSESAATYRTLTLAHYLLDNHEQAIDSLNRAFSLDEAILADRDPMVAGIRSYAEVGKFEVSRKLLAILLSRNPEIERDDEFLRAGYFVRQKMVDAGIVSE
jgi:tetratricopeptide (TPR) repeat protein